MALLETDIQAFLHDYIDQADWRIQTPQRGFSYGKRFIGISSHSRVFVRLGVDPDVIQILSDADLTPAYLAGGIFNDTTITVQEYVEASHPDRKWYANNVTTWVHLMKKLQSLTILRQYFPLVENETYHTLLARYIDQIKEAYRKVLLDQNERGLIESLIEQYEKRTPFVQGEGLVPSHGDPNADNMLITRAKVFLIDWDALHLSDPMRDVAQVLWWMYPKSQWSEMLDLLCIDLADQHLQDRFYLYISTRALYVSLFFVQVGQQHWAKRFLKDALAAMDHQPPDELLIS
jgi:thiamine kinase-like enzyme